jgi:hypothetical protein
LAAANAFRTATLSAAMYSNRTTGDSKSLKKPNANPHPR